VTAVTQDVNWKRPKDGNSALHLSAEMGHIEADSVFFWLGFHLQKVVMKASNNGDERSTQMLIYPTHGDLPSGNQTWQLEIHYKWSF
jgi:hypothetical protein